MKRTLASSLLHILVWAMIAAMVLPIAVTVGSSLLDYPEYSQRGMVLIPREPTVEAYRHVFTRLPAVLRSFGVSLLIALVGGGLGTVFCFLYAYAISRPEYKARFFARVCFWTMVLPIMITPEYVFYKMVYGLRESIPALIIPMLANPAFILITASYLRHAVPQHVLEAARLDGCGEYRALWSIVLPLVRPGVMGLLFLNLFACWNNEVNGLYLIRMMKNIEPITNLLMEIQANYNYIERTPMMMHHCYHHHPVFWKVHQLVILLIALVPVVLAFYPAQKQIRRLLTMGAVKDMTRFEDTEPLL